MKTAQKGSFGFGEGLLVRPTIHKFEGGKRQVDWDLLKEYIEANKENISSVDVGLAEDWAYTSGTVFEDGKYQISSSVYGSSDWATPAFEVTFKDGVSRMFECWKLGANAVDWFS